MTNTKQQQRSILTRFYENVLGIDAIEANNRAESEMSSDLITAAKIVETNSFNQEFDVQLLIIPDDDLIFWRVRPMGVDFYKDEPIELFEQDPFDYINITFHDEDDLHGQHDIDLDTFSDNVLDANNGAPFKDWRECLQTMRGSQPKEVKRAIVAYLTYVESEDWIDGAIQHNDDLNERLINNEADRYMDQKYQETRQTKEFV